jgi:DNA-binding response OmpR family regulator
MNSINQLPQLLIVDDEKALRLLLKEIFKKKFEVISLEGGKACLTFLKVNPLPKVVVLDLMMPDLSGMEVIKEIRANANWEDLAIIILSAKESSIDRIAALKAGADDFLVKPFNPEELTVRIETILRRINRNSWYTKENLNLMHFN